MKPALLSRKFHSRGAAAIMIAVAAIYVILTGHITGYEPEAGNQGIGLPSPSAWPMPGWASTCLNILLNILIVVLMVAINRAYNVLRAMTWLPVGLFALMQAAFPAQLLALNSGTFVCLVLALCMFLIFSICGEPDHVRTIFMTFLLLSFGAVFQYCFIFFIPIFWIICLQMRAMNTRCMIGSLLGILTVWIILAGFGIISIDSLRFPQITDIFSKINLRSTLFLVTLSALTAFMMITAILANLMKTIAYNARARAFNGALTVMSLAAVAAMIFDYDNLPAYLPLLNFMAAYQITHYLVNHRFERQYIGILAIIGVYIVLYLWRLAL